MFLNKKVPAKERKSVLSSLHEVLLQGHFLHTLIYGGSTRRMLLSQKPMTHRLFLCCSFFLFVLTLTACSDSGGTRTGNTANGTTSRSASPAPTSTAQKKTYTGANFSFTYPANWQAQGSGNQVIFQDVQGLNALTVIITPNPGGLKSAGSLADATFPAVEKAILTNPQSSSLSPTTMVAGETWIQRGATGTLSTGGQSVPGTLILLVDNHPASSPATLAYEIYYGGPTSTFEQIKNTVFQAMLQSFTFSV